MFVVESLFDRSVLVFNNTIGDKKETVGAVILPGYQNAAKLQCYPTCGLIGADFELCPRRLG